MSALIQATAIMCSLCKQGCTPFKKAGEKVAFIDPHLSYICGKYLINILCELTVPSLNSWIKIVLELSS